VSDETVAPLPLTQPDEAASTPSIRLSRSPSEAILTLGGIVDINSVAEVQHTAIEAALSGTSVRLDWSAVERVDASVLQVLMALRADMARQGKTFETSEIGPGLRDYLHTAGLTGTLASVSPGDGG
jgi:anti-anti-sigma regulatory factor